MECAPDSIECILRQIEQSIDALGSSDPLPGFLLTILATLIGAFVGAFLALGSSLLLQKQQRRQAEADRLNEKVAAIISSLTELAAAMEPTRKAGNRRGLAAMPREVVLQNILIAQMGASDEEAEVLERARENVIARNWPQGRGVQNVEHVSRNLLLWRRGQLTDREAIDKLSQVIGYDVPPPGEEW